MSLNMVQFIYMPNAVPEIFRPILWSYDFERIDPVKHRKTLIIQAINYGTLAHWRWLRQSYGRDSVRQVLATVPATQIRPRARRLAVLMFDVDHLNYAPRGTH
jgi:hypothetical protein